jgi:hypothetical protein
MPNYIKDPNNSKKQVPGPLPDSYHGRRSTPTNCGFVKTPNYIIFNTAMQDEFGLFFGTSASYASNVTEDQTAGHKSGSLQTFMTSSARYEKFTAGLGAVGTKLDFHPTAISSSARDAGQVTFVYKGGLDGSGRP